MRVKRFLVFFFFIFLLTWHSLIHAMDFEISGVVSDEITKSPLAGANVFLKSATIGTVTDSEGFFSLTIPEKHASDSLIVEYLGYKEFRNRVANMPANSTISLSPLILEVDKGITVYAEKLNLARQELPHSATIIKLEDIERYGTSEISDLFKSDPSVRIIGNDLDGRFVEIRGSDPNEVNVYVDGIQINNLGYNNAADLSVISTDNIEKVEVLKGSNLVLLGSGAFGGVVNITTRNATKPEYGLKLKYGSWLSRLIAAQINIPLHNRLFLNYFGTLSAFSPEIEYYSSEEFEEKTQTSAVKTSRQNHNLTLNYFTDTGQYTGKFMGSLLDYDKPGWNNLRKNILLAAAYRGEIFKVPNFDLNVDYLYGDDFVDRGNLNFASFENNFLTQRVHLRLAKNFSGNPNSYPQFGFQFLSEYFHDELFNDSQMKDKTRSSTLYEASLYDNRGSLGGVLSIGDKLDSLGEITWKLFGGIRGEFLASGENYKISSYGFQINVIKQHWQFSPYINYGENIKFPTLLDNAYIIDVINVSINTGNLNIIKLLPESSKSREIGFDFHYLPSSSFFKNLSFQFAYYTTEIANKIIKRPLEDAIIKTQLGLNNTQGIESTIKMGDMFGAWTLSASYGELNVSNPLLYSYKPAQKYSIQIDYGTYEGFYFMGLFYYEGKSFAWDYVDQNDFKIAEVDPFFDIDFSMGYQFDLNPLKLNITLSGYNVLDNAGYKYYNLRKRFLQVGLGIKY